MKGTCYVSLIQLIEVLQLLRRKPFICSLKQAWLPKDSFPKTCTILLTVLFERQQGFGDTAHRHFQFGKEDVVNELQAFDKITIKYKAYTTIIRNRAAICLPLIRTVDSIPSILCVER